MSRRLAPAQRPALILVALCAAGLVLTGNARLRPYGWDNAQPPRVAPAPAAAREKPNVILISIDTLAAKDMSLYGYRLPTTPNIDAFAQTAHVFERFYANSNYTVPTVATMATGRYPSTHRVTQLRGRLPPEQGRRNLAAELKKQGYVTASVVANDGAHPLYLGFGEGVDYMAATVTDMPCRVFSPFLTLARTHAWSAMWDWWCGAYIYFIYPALDIGDLQRRNWFPADRLVQTAAAAARDGGRPLFLWTHFMSPHEPYLPPPPFRGRFLASDELDAYNEQIAVLRFMLGPYDVEKMQATVDKLRLRYAEYIAYTDDGVRQLLEQLDQAGVMKNAVVMITADHGQSFEKGYHGHAGTMLHEPVTRIPLILRLPGQARGSRLATNAEQVDLLPTVLEAVGAAVPDWAEGESLLPLLSEGKSSGRPKFSFDLSRESRYTPPRRGNFAVMQGRHKLVHHQVSGCEELYDIGSDVEENHNIIAATPPERVAELRGLLAQKLGMSLTPRERRAEPVPDEVCARPWAS